MRHCERKGDLITEIYISNKKNKIYPPTITLSREVKLNGIYLTSSSWLSFWKVILCWRLNIGQFPIGWSLTSDGNYITLGKKEPLLLVQSTCSLYLLPGFFIHDPILLALQLPQTKLGWPPMDKSSYPPNCSVPPLKGMISSAHWCETKRYVYFMPTHVALSSCFFSRTRECFPVLLL